ncbi:unnamed protein product, partial [Polarella glacialis]
MRPALRLGRAWGGAAPLQRPLQQRLGLAQLQASPVFLQAAQRGFSSDAAPAAAVVKELRDRTGASMGKCREALKEEGSDIEKAVEWLKKRGVRSMEKRTADSAEALISMGLTPSAAAIVEVKAETDYVTRNEIFQQFIRWLSDNIAASPVALAGGNVEELRLEDGPGRPRQVAPGTVKEVLLELGSVLGEKLLLGQVLCLAAPTGGVVAGYVHPKQADGLPGTGRMAATVALRPAPAAGCDLVRLRVIAAHLARHTVAAQPRFLTVGSIPAETLRKEREIFRAAHLEQVGPKKTGIVDEK